MGDYNQNSIQNSGDCSPVIVGHDNTIQITVGSSKLRLSTIRNIRRRFSRQKGSLGLLTPYAELTNFVGHELMLAEFVDWATGKTSYPLSIRAIGGAGGSGKTRFAMKLMETLEGCSHPFDYTQVESGTSLPRDAWLAGFVDGEQLEAMDAFFRLDNACWPQPTLLIFDYAAGRLEHIREFLHVLSQHLPDTAQVRVLLLERSAADDIGWAAELKRAFIGQWDSTISMPSLPEPVRFTFLQEAICELMARQNLDSTVPTIDLEKLKPLLQAERWGNPLLLLLAVSAALEDGHDIITLLSQPRSEVIDKVAERELRRIDHGTLASALSQSQRHLLLAVAAATLTRGLSAEQMMQFFRSLNDSGAHADLNCWHLVLELYGSTVGCDGIEVCRFVEPDIVGERFVALVAVKLFGGAVSFHSAFIQAVFSLAEPTVCASIIRMIVDYSNPKEASPSGTAQLALQWLEVITPKNITQDNIAHLFMLSNALPSYSLALKQYACRISLMIVEQYEIIASQKHPCMKSLLAHINPVDECSYSVESGLAYVYNEYAYRAYCCGEFRRALVYAQKSTDLYRKLYGKNPDLFSSDFARSLNAIVCIYGATEEYSKSLEYALLEVELYEKLYERNPDSFAFDLGVAYNTISARFGSCYKQDIALQYACKAIEIYENICGKNHDRYAPELAMSYNNAAVLYGENNRPDMSLEYARRANELYEKLYAENSDAFAVDMTMCWHTLANCYGNCGDFKSALEYALRACDLCEKLYANDRDLFSSNLAANYNDTANFYNKCGVPLKALEYAIKSVDIYGDIYLKNHDTFAADMAMSLGMLATCYRDCGNFNSALENDQKSVKLYEELYGKDSDVFAPRLASGYNCLAISYRDCGNHKAALRSALASSGIYDNLCQKNYDIFAMDMARCWNTIANCYSDCGESRMALEFRLKATRVHESISDKNPNTFLFDLVICYNNLAEQYSDVNDFDTAVKYALKAVDLCRKKYQDDSDAVARYLAVSLNTLGNQYSNCGKLKEALACTKEAVVLYEKLYSKNPDAFAASLADGYNNLSCSLHACGDFKHALDVNIQGLRTLSSYFFSSSCSYVEKMDILVENHITMSGSTKINPDMELIGPILAALEQLKHDNKQG